MEVRKVAAKNPNAPFHPEFFNLLYDTSDDVRSAAANNQNCSIMVSKFEPSQNKLTQFPITTYLLTNRLFGPTIPEYRSFFVVNDECLRIQFARNPNAPIFFDFSIFFEDGDEEVRRHVAANPNTPSLPGYHKLFKDQSAFVRMYAAANRNASKLADFAILLEDSDTTVAKFAQSNIT